MKSTEAFKNIIQAHLEKVAIIDPLFAQTLLKPNKNIEDCITYILNTVKATECQGFADDEVFQMAIHYYDEDGIEIGNPITSHIVVNQVVELTEQDIQEAKKMAMDKVVSQEISRLQKKNTPKKEEVKTIEQPSLFGNL